MLGGPRFQLAPEVRRRIPVAVQRAWRRAVQRAAHRLSVSGARLNTLAIRVVADAEMAKLHLKYMGSDKPTDVLSFPAAEVPGESAAGLGDLVVDWDAVCRQARDGSLAAQLDEAISLCVHGLAHLLGHDHGGRMEARRMLRAERRASRSAGLIALQRPYG